MALGLPKKAGSVSAASAACVLAVLAVAAAGCDFKPECRPGETYRVPIPCEGKCSNFFQCENGVATEKKCGSYFWRQKEFDPDTLECVRSTDCSWWIRVSTTTTSSSTSAPTTIPATTTPSTPSSTTSLTPTSTEGTTPTPTTTPAQPPSSHSADPVTSTPTTASPHPRPADSSSATPSAAAGLLLASLALLL